MFIFFYMDRRILQLVKFQEIFINYLVVFLCNVMVIVGFLLGIWVDQELSEDEDEEEGKNFDYGLLWIFLKFRIYINIFFWYGCQCKEVIDVGGSRSVWRKFMCLQNFILCIDVCILG